MAAVDVLDQTGKKSGSIDLPADLFDVVTNVPLMHQVVVAQLGSSPPGNTQDQGSR
jgi:large subunit ribosomal protein L4